MARRWIAAALALAALLTTACGTAACRQGDQVVEHGQGVTAADGCNQCTCDDGTLTCTAMACAPSD